MILDDILCHSAVPASLTYLHVSHHRATMPVSPISRVRCLPLGPAAVGAVEPGWCRPAGAVTAGLADGHGRSPVVACGRWWSRGAPAAPPAEPPRAVLDATPPRAGRCRSQCRSDPRPPRTLRSAPRSAHRSAAAHRPSAHTLTLSPWVTTGCALAGSAAAKVRFRTSVRSSSASAALERVWRCWLSSVWWELGWLVLGAVRVLAEGWVGER